MGGGDWLTPSALADMIPNACLDPWSDTLPPAKAVALKRHRVAHRRGSLTAPHTVAPLFYGRHSSIPLLTAIEQHSRIPRTVFCVSLTPCFVLCCLSNLIKQLYSFSQASLFPGIPKRRDFRRCVGTGGRRCYAGQPQTSFATCSLSKRGWGHVNM